MMSICEHQLRGAKVARENAQRSLELLQPLASVGGNPDVISDYLFAVQMFAMTHSGSELVSLDLDQPMQLARLTLEKHPKHHQLIRGALAVAYPLWLRYVHQNRLADSLQLAEECMEIAQGDDILKWRLLHAHSIALLGNHSKAVQSISDIRDTPKLAELSPATILAVYAVAARTARSDSELDESQQQSTAEEYLKTSTRLFQEQIANGSYTMANHLDELLAHPDLDELRRRPDVRSELDKLRRSNR